MYQLGALIWLFACATIQVDHGTPSPVDLDVPERDGRYFLPVEIDGVERWFFLDSGYTHTTCDDDLARELSLEKRGTVTVYGMMGSLRAWTGDLPPVSLGGHTVSGIRCTVRDLPTTSSLADLPGGRHLAGVLGMDVLSNFVWTFDPQARTLELHPRGTVCGAGTTVRLRGTPRLPRLRLSLDDGPYGLFLLDTGATRTLAHTRTTRELSGEEQEVAVRGTGSGEAERRTTTRYAVSHVRTPEGLDLGGTTVSTLPHGSVGLAGLDLLGEQASCWDAETRSWTLLGVAEQ